MKVEAANPLDRYSLEADRMIYRVAAAIIRGLELYESHPEKFGLTAERAIRAMRVPTEKMRGCVRGYGAPDEAFWVAMIDAAAE